MTTTPVPTESDRAAETAATEPSAGGEAARRRRRPRLRKALMGLAVVFVLMLALEGVLRLFGWPTGTFDGAFTTSRGLWEPGFSGDLAFGPIRYHVSANQQGFRGPPLRTGADLADLRVVAIGDSITEGFYVDNEDTYPAQLREILRERGHDAEVINAAAGGGSIDRFYLVLRDVVVPLSPDVVIVTFVSNDIYELGGRTFDEIDHEADSSRVERPWPAALVTGTAIGEAGLDLYLRLRSPLYKYEQRNENDDRAGGRRYDIDGGENYEENARLFLQKWKDVDGLVLGETIEPAVRVVLDHYFEILDQFRKLCEQHEIKVLYVYFPAYSQVYLPDAPTTCRDLIREQVERMGIPFLDLTDSLRDGGRTRPLHLAPLDWHLNPAGNHVMARAIADALEQQGWLDES